MKSTLLSSDHSGEGADGAKLHRQPPPPPPSSRHQLHEGEAERQGLVFMAATLSPAPLMRLAPAAHGGGRGNSQLLGAAFDVSLLAMKANKHGSLSGEDLVLLNHHTDAIRQLSVTYLRSSSTPSSPSSPPTVVDVPEQQPYSSPSFLFSSASSSTSSATNFESLGAPLVRLQGEQLLASAHARDAFMGQCAPAIRKRRNRGPSLPRGVRRACAVCSATETVQWRGGADGRATLCNACGLRFRHTMRKHRETREEEELTDDNKQVASSSTVARGGCNSEASPPQERRRSSIYSLLN